MSNVPYIAPRDTAALITANGANYQEQAWERVAIKNAMPRHPFGAMARGSSNLNKRLPNAAIITTTTLNAGIYGQTANFRVRAPGGGFGIQGAGGFRTGKGVQVKDKMYTLTTGVQWHGYNYNNVSAAQTLIGVGNIDTETRGYLQDFFGWLMGTHCEATVVAEATAKASTNVRYANNKSTLDELTSADTLAVDDVNRLKNNQVSNSSMPFSMRADDNYNDVLEYLLMAPQFAMQELTTSSTWTNFLKDAGVRGDQNYLFGGGLPRWNGTRMFEWQLQTALNDGPSGSFAAPYAFLGEAISAGTAVFSIKGGGNSAANKAALNAPYFFAFKGARWKAFEQEKIAAETTNTKYVIAYNATNGKWAFASYKVIPTGDLDTNGGTTADSNTITVYQFLSATNSGAAAKTTVGSVVWDTGIWSGKTCEWSDLPVGSKIYAANAKGQPYNLVYMLGRESLLSGFGRVTADGGTGFGQRTEERQNAGVFVELGMHLSYGANAIPNVDGIPAFTVMHVAINPDGLPTIV